VVLSALAGQLADMRDKAAIIRIVKAAEIGIMFVGAVGLTLAWQGVLTKALAIPLMLLALFAMGVHSTFFGPIKYSILPQHLKPEEVLSGTGLVEAGTYLAIMSGTILAGFISVQAGAIAVVVVAGIGFASSRFVPSAPPLGADIVVDYNPWRASIALIRQTMQHREVYYAILAISFFWTIGAVLFIQFPPLAKNVLMASKEVASVFLVVFSVGIAIGSVAINVLLRGTVSARYAPASVLAMGAMVAAFYFVCVAWNASLTSTHLMSAGEFITHPWPGRCWDRC
jgi:MFS family permease